MDDVELQRRLARLAERTAPPPRDQLAGAVVARHRAQRRQAAGMTGLVAAVAALVVVSTTVLDGRDNSSAATAVDAAATESAVAAAAVDVLAGPTRGSLAEDAAFVEAVRQLPWTSEATAGAEVPDAPPDTRRVVFAGDVPGGRWALVAGTNDEDPEQDDPGLQTDLGALSDVAVAWFAGPEGATPDQLELLSVPRGVDPRYPQALSDSASGALVVVAAPGDVVEVSPRPEIAADATVSRAWQPVDAPDGLVVLALPSSDTSTTAALRYRVTRDGAEVTITGPDGRSQEGRTPPSVPLTWLRPAPPAAPGDVLVASEIEFMLARTGLATQEVSFAVPWAGDVAGPRDRPARVTVLAAALPSGALYLSAPYGYALDDSGGVGGSGCGSDLLPSGAPLDQRTFVLRCDVVDGTSAAMTTSSLIVVAPAAATKARALDLDGGVLAEFGLTDGVAVVPFPEGGATVETLTADGTVLATTRPLTFADLGD